MAFTCCCILDSMGKVDVKAHNSCHRSVIHQEREEEKQCRPYLRTSLFHVFNPGAVPRMSKVHKQNQLNQDKQEGTDETKIHPHCKVIIREGNVNTRLFYCWLYTFMSQTQMEVKLSGQDWRQLTSRI